MPDSHRPLLTLRHRDFRRLWLSQFVSLTGSQMQAVAINWHVYLLTRSPLALGFVGLSRVLPIVVFSLWGGIVADRYDRRRVMLWTQSTMTVIAALLAAATFLRHDTIWLIYGLNALSAAAVAFDNPTRHALVPRLVPRGELPGALALNLTIFHASMICGPALAGLMIAGTGAVLDPGGGLQAHIAASASASASSAGPAAEAGAAPLGAAPRTTGVTPGRPERYPDDASGALPSPASPLKAQTGGLGWLYAFNAVSFLGVLGALLFMSRDVGKVGEGEAAADHPIQALRQGLRFVFTTPLMVWSMALDFFATFFSGAMSLLPIFADQVLRVGPLGYGLLVSAPAVGAILGSIYTSLWPLPRRHGRVFLWSVAAYGAATVVYGLSRSYALTFLALAGSGARGPRVHRDPADPAPAHHA